MKVIYNESKAILEKQQKDIEIPQQNKRAKTHNAIVVIITALVMAGLFFGWAFVRGGVEAIEGDVMGFVLPLSLVCMIVAHFAKGFMKEVVYDYERYSANTKYYLAKGNKKVLDHSLKYNERAGGYELWLTLEDQNHVVTHASLWPYCLKSQTQTNLTETIVDLEKSIVYQPYKT